ncbi:chondroitin sulfate proteoglycan 4-like [Brienomyrus brachyistius]|uniref:chondroitin sulfate proteoglycan 4-like n=1 Tax=Brienomyrus brachyistius TaxID=42636 RepID=UPI0020B20A5D|nr:chondroitin sulfate proteoglycan 4-like [Brienomyrus brachyistius]
MDFVKRPDGALWNGLLLLLSLISGRSLGASFYGDGFVQLKTAESSSQTSLHIRFRTSSSNGMLFLAAGQSDYCLAELSSGYLQVRLELGSGERLLRSERRMPLNDMAWHSVELHHEQYNVTLILDKHSQASLEMPGPEHELNIQEGLYVGGTGGLDKPYLTTDPVGFRGCIDEVLFNQHNLLSSLRPYYGFKNVHEVSLGCSPQFLASEDEPISFFSSKAYISFPPWNAQQEGIFEFVVHTSAEEGIILYNSARHDDFIAMEIRGGLPVAVVGKGGTKTELRSLSFVNDQKWHHVKLHFTSKSLELTVDEETVITSISSHSRALHLKGSLFVGGIDESTRSVVRKLGLVSVSGKRIRGGSFKGCLKDINVNGVKIGLPNVMVSKDVSVGCEPDKEKQSASTIPPGNLSPFVTPTPMIYTSTLVNGLDKKHGLHFLALRNLVVSEGGRASLESKHIKVNLDFKKLGIRQSQIVFKVDEQPVHGQLRLDVDQDQEENTFSMLDLWHGRVMYIHGGSEDLTDFFMFSVYTSSRKEVPSYLKGNKLYRYDIIINPTNDAPELSLPEGNLFLVLENSKKPLTTEVLKATDIDSNYTDLVYSVLGNLNADAGFLENDENPGKAVTTFSHHDLEKGKICYVHHGVKNSRIVFRVSDGDKVSNTVVLRILAIPLEYKISNNTGVTVLQGDMALIGTRHLAVQTNAIKQVVDIRYDVIEPPQFGELQRLHTSGEWKLTNMFSQRLLEKERLRYLSTFQEIQTDNVTDHFRCKITVGTVATNEISFSIIVNWVQYILVRNKLVEVDKVRKMVLDSEHLYAIVKGVSLLESELHFRLLSLPRRGNMLLNGKVLKKNSTFSQNDVRDLKVQYELVHRVQDDTKDKFSFQVFSKYAHSASYEFQIGIKADANAIILKNEGLSVMEGESKLITKDELFSETLNTKTLYYSIIDSPKHGKLKRINLSSSSSRNDNITAFTNQEILEERIVYVHDDSETTYDQFTFIISTSKVIPPILDDENGAVEGIFNISVQLVNDEKPVRVVDKVFHVVRDGQRLLTLEDLCYHDTDSDFDDGQLIYTRRGIPMGDLVLANDTSHRLFQFQQKDLEQKRVLFIHHGVSFGRFVLFVSDGKHYASTLLDVHAEDAYLKIENNTGILVQKGQAGALTSANLSVTTNLDVRDNKEITYNLLTLPKHGRIYCNSLLVDSFTQHDLKMGAVVYHHDDSRNLWDVFQFTVKVKEMHQDSSVNVKVYLESHQQPPRVIHCRALLVEEGKPVKINKRDLEVIHEDNLPLEIIFTVKVPPSYGYLRRFAEDEDRYFGTQETPIQIFSQKDVNAGNVQYMQVGATQLNDTFVLDVTNGITEVHNIRMLVDVIPSHIPLEVSNITLNEGSAKALTKEVIKVVNRHFSGLNFQYYVSEGPYHGRIEHSQFPGVQRTAFTRKQVEHEFMYYVHDNSETMADNFTIIANDTDIGKQSLPRTVFVNVRLINDEPPVIKVNRILRVWVDSITEITSNELKAQDKDSPQESLEYIVTPPSMGHLALKSSPHKPILNFTQAHIDWGQLVFVHSGAMSGGFNFQVNDGVNFSPRQIFSITARALILTLERNLPLKMLPGSSTPISAEELLAVTNDNDGAQNRSIVFTVISPPKLGRLVKIQADNTTAEISSFTQTMVDESEVIYEQSRADSVGWVATDFFSFTISSPPASLEAQIFNIDISYENTDPEHKTILLANTGAVVTEGEKVLIDKAKLDASNLMAKLPEVQRHSYEVWYQVKSLPWHGVIIVGERNLTKEKPKFSQYILNKFGITYQHDNSETTYDNFVFDAWLNLKSKPAVRPLEDKDVVEESFNITILPVNDQPPVLITKSPGLSVVQGDAIVLASANLNVEDLDNPPEDINYTVISKPSNGFLAMKDSLNESILTFTQADINNEKVYFVQDGSPQSGVFYFSVTDGKHRPVYKLFNVEVNEITISLINNTEVELEQGQTSVILSNEHLAAKTSGRNSVIQYQVTQPPHYGILLISNEAVHMFDQNDLRLGKLSYNMTDLSSADDSFEFTAFTSKSNLTKQIVKIAVRPLIQLGMDVKIPNGILVKLKGFINASALTVLSGTDPQFEILSQPKYGKVVKIQANEKGIPRPIASFSFQDVEQGKVAIEEKANMTGKEYLNDSFVFVLKAEKVQPSRGEFNFTIVPFDPSLVNPVTTDSPVHTTKLPTSGQTTVLGTLPHTTIDPLASSQRPHKTLQKFKGRNRWGSHQRNNTTASVVPRTTSGQQDHPLKITPVRTESFPRPATDPLFIILPLLACLLLIIIFIVLMLVFRRRREKRARPVLTQDLIATPSPSSPYLGQPERSLAIPSVVVTPLSPSCPGSPIPDRMHDGALAPIAGPQEASLLLCSWSNLGPETVQHCRTTPPTLRSNQYWV